MTLPGLSAPRSFRSCRHGQVQEPHRTQPVPNLAQRQHRETLVTKHESLKKVDLKFLRKTRSAQEHSREGLQTTRAGSAPVGAVEACPEPKESEPQVHMWMWFGAYPGAFGLGLRKKAYFVLGISRRKWVCVCSPSVYRIWRQTEMGWKSV